MSKEKKVAGKSKLPKRSNGITGQGLSPAGNEKETPKVNVEDIVKSDNEKSSSERSEPMASGDNVERGKEVELNSPDEGDDNGTQLKLSTGEDQKNELLNSQDQLSSTEENAKLDEASTSGTRKADEKVTEHLKQLPLNGYVHSTSSIKASTKNFTYFNFKFQTQNGFVDGICYDRSLHSQVKQRDETQRSIRLSNYTLKRALDDPNDMIICISKRTKMENVFKCSFDYTEPQKKISKIANIKDVSDFTLISVIAKVHVTSKETEVNVHGRQVKKLDVNIADDTGVIKVTLWDKSIPLVKESQVYNFIDVRVRSFQNEKYLSTTLDTVITLAKSEASKMEVVSELMDDKECSSEKTIIINKIGGVHEILRYAQCNICKRRLNNLQSNLCVCDSCGLSQEKTSEDETHFSVGIYIGGEHDTVLRLLKDKVQLFLKQYNERAESHNVINVDSATNSQIIQALVSSRNLKITFHTKSKLVSSIVFN